MTTEIRPFRIDIPQADVDDLRERLARVRFPAQLPAGGGWGGEDDGAAADGLDWSTGVPVEYLRELVTHWRDAYDWRAHEKQLNELPQFVTTIDRVDVHFVHARSAVDGATPLLLTHGWPGSFVELVGLIDELTAPADPADAFHVVIPSLPGFGFSGPVTDTGWTTGRIARAWAELMTRLGYERFGVHGGDIGAAVSPEVGRVVPERVIGVHVNGGPGPLPPMPMSDEERASLDPLDADRVARVEQFMNTEFGYIAIQGTRPLTLGHALVDSPSGQLAWIVDKFREWTWPREAAPDAVVGRDVLLTNASIYWFTASAASAAWVGYAQEGGWGEPAASSGVPTGAIVFAHDVGIRRYAEREHAITRWTDVTDRGGHFAALEEPELLLADLRAFFRDVRAARSDG